MQKCFDVFGDVVPTSLTASFMVGAHNTQGPCTQTPADPHLLKTKQGLQGTQKHRKTANEP